ncbi:tetratricopeptide repeat protein [Nitrosophilus labii]|uniref:tetratricopeptide repeat protein n=1 Tax=Nitrosophilus labii TaxID=2706014 RepID=UPI001656FAD0|nr:tetratricopeptide repeat protein [Nitrosophilus labii]
MKKIILFAILAIFSYSYDDIIKKSYYDSYNYEKMGDYEDAIKSLMPVIQKYPDAYTPNLRLGWLYYLDKKYKNALYHYKKAAIAAKSAISPRLGIINIYILQQKYDDALKICNDILKVDYYNYYANLYLVKILIGKSDFINAKAIAYKMLSLYPTDISFLELLAKIYQKTDNLENAKKIYEDILILDPKNFAAYNFFQSLIR